MRDFLNQFGFTAEELNAFANGDCGYLALALNAATGWDIVVITPIEAAETDFWYHMGVRMPDGRILDIKGTWDTDTFHDLWDSETYEVAIYDHDVEWATESVHKRPTKFPDYDAAVYAGHILDRGKLIDA